MLNGTRKRRKAIARNEGSTGATGRPLSVLLSIKTEHMQRIFAGAKHYELRKSIPSVPFKRVFLYETGGAGIVGCFDVGRIIKAPKAELWKQVGNAATTKDRFDSYFSSAKEGYAIEILNPVRFEGPVTIEQLNGEFVQLTPPQSFVVLDPGQPLHRILESERSQSLALRPSVNLQLKAIRQNQREDYRRLVTKHVGAQYDDIDDSFVSSTLKIHDLGFDPSGFFTSKKQVLGIFKKKTCLGFTTLTYKSGGCVKTGPTILYRQFRGKGFGVATRKAIEAYLRPLNIRKIYCTCPDTAEATIKYLLASGMRIEAHLERHYSRAHNELVFGKLLLADDPGQHRSYDAEVAEGDIAEAEVFHRKQLVSDFRAMFGKTWSPVSSKFAAQVVAQGTEQRVSARHHHNKPKRLVCLGSGSRCIGSVVLLPKRGGAVKGLLLRMTDHENSLRKLVDAALTCAAGLNGRKLYFLHPIEDATVLMVLRGAGFSAEGLLRAPYVPGQDVVIYSKYTA